jgi:hypothetical protein
MALCESDLSVSLTHPLNKIGFIPWLLSRKHGEPCQKYEVKIPGELSLETAEGFVQF